MKEYKIFVINPGSTSTKLALFRDETCIFSDNIFHDSSELLPFDNVNAQLPYRMDKLWQSLQHHKIDLRGTDAIVGRGGGCYPLEGGTYIVDDLMIEHTRNSRSNLYHVSNLGVQMVEKVHDRYGGMMLTVDPPVIDEFTDLARISGCAGIFRHSMLHALSLKATAMQHARKKLGKKYKDCNFIVCHIDGGISVSAHRKGKMIDGNNASGGEGPFTPTRVGGLALTDLVEHFPDKTIKELMPLITEAGGLTSYFGTSDSDKIHSLVEAGNRKASLVWNGMIYQIIRYIGAMSTVLGGEVDGILLTGGLLRFQDIEDQIREKCQWIAPVSSYPGEFEMEALAKGALRVLTGEEEARHYSGRPVWEGFE